MFRVGPFRGGGVPLQQGIEGSSYFGGVLVEPPGLKGNSQESPGAGRALWSEESATGDWSLAKGFLY